MAKWRAEAISRLPELRKKIDAAENVMALWDDFFRCAFVPAYKAEPPDDSLIARIYAYADWCVQAPRNPDASHDPLTAVLVCFYEDIPAFRPARNDMPRWFTYDEVADSEQVFKYMIGDEQYRELLRYMDKHRNRYMPRDQRSTP
jgi:hypothetical protein